MTNTKAIFRLLGLIAATLPIFFLVGCDDDSTTTIAPKPEPFVYFVRDYEYVERQIFDLGGPGDFQPGDSIQLLLIYQETPNNLPEPVPYKLYANLYVDPDRPDLYQNENRLLSSGEDGVVLVDPEDFTLCTIPQSARHYIVLNETQSDLSLGVFMIVHRAGGTVDTIGFDSEGTMENPKRLKLVYAKHPLPTFQTWDYMWRNTYRIAKGLTINGFHLRVMKGLAGSELSANSVDYQTDSSGWTQPYLQVLGLDQYGPGDIPGRDGLVDDREAVFRPDWGLLIFPSRRPFADTVTSYLNGTAQKLMDPVPGIYHYETQTERMAASKYFLRFELYPK